jgi:hypothetical protein
MRFLSVMVVVGCVPVDGAVQSGHAGALNNFFGLTWQCHIRTSQVVSLGTSNGYWSNERD